MLIQCHQQVVKDVTLGKQLVSTPYGMVMSDALHMTFQRGTIDVFDTYYKAPRTPEMAPHYQFARMKRFEDVVVFLKRFGFPAYQGGRALLLGEFLVAAKRLRHAMTAWVAVRQRNTAGTQEGLAALRFTRDSNAHWYFWPSRIAEEWDKVHEKTWQERFMEFMQSMAQQQPNPALRVGSQEWIADIVTNGVSLLHTKQLY